MEEWWRLWATLTSNIALFNSYAPKKRVKFIQIFFSQTFQLFRLKSNIFSCLTGARADRWHDDILIIFKIYYLLDHLIYISIVHRYNYIYTKWINSRQEELKNKKKKQKSERKELKQNSYIKKKQQGNIFSCDLIITSNSKRSNTEKQCIYI